MRTLLIALFVTVVIEGTADARQKACGQSADQCVPCQSSVRWYKAKDGTYREMMPYVQALSRAEDADDMEPVLKKSQADLAETQAQIAALQSETARVKAELDAQVADLQAQLATEKQTVVSLKERADKAEAAHKLCIEEVAQLREQGTKQGELLTVARAEGAKVTEERDALKSANTSMEKQVSDLTAAKTAAEDALRTAQSELEKMKQDAAESKKAKVEEEGAPPEGENPDAPGSESTEPATNPAQ